MKKLMVGVFAAVAAAVVAQAEYSDAYIESSDSTVRVIQQDGRIVYVFANALGRVKVKMKQFALLDEELLVGGGGAGGKTMGGGGGGGGVSHCSELFPLDAGDTFTFVVGAGGKPGATYQSGGNPGEASVLTIDSSVLSAGGGGGGTGYSGPGSEGAAGGGGANNVKSGYAGTEGECHSGGAGVTFAGGGGGGAGEDGDDVDTAAYKSGDGGDGKICGITGDNVCYGGGGGGGGNSTPNWGDYEAGAGGAGGGGAGGKDANGTPGEDGLGGGGGGGGWNGSNKDGARGGCGTVVLSFCLNADASRYFKAESVGDQVHTGGAIRPEPVVRNARTRAVLAKDADYTLDWRDNVDCGVGRVIVTGREGSVYEGLSKVVAFNIVNAFYAAADGDPEASGATASVPTTLAHALELAGTGDHIILAAGTYSLSETVVVDKPVKIFGDIADRSRVVLDGCNVVTPLSLAAGASIESVTVARGRSAAQGGGVILGEGAVLRDCVVENCAVVGEAAAAIRGGGVYVGGTDAAVVGCVIRDCVVSNAADATSVKGGGLYCEKAGFVLSDTTITRCAGYGRYNEVHGGGAYVTGASDEIVRTVVDHCTVTNVVRGGDWFPTPIGAGLFAEKITISDSFIGWNVCQGLGGGMRAFSCIVTDTTCASNRVCMYANNGLVGTGGGAYTDKSTYRRCLFKGNYAECYGGALSEWKPVTLSGNSIEDCVFDGNESSNGGGFMLQGANHVIRNCLFIRNSASIGGGIAIYEGPDSCDNLIENCQFWYNTTPSGGFGSCVGAGFGSYNLSPTNIIRNCFFKGNSGVGCLSLKSWSDVGTFGPRVENCTFVDNPVSAPVVNSAKYNLFGSVCGYLDVVNCLFSGNGKDSVDSVTVSRGGVVNCLTGTAQEIRYADADNGDYRLRARSPAVDAGKPLGWMAEGHDLGSSAYTLTKSGTYGVIVDFGEPRKRVLGKGPDIGCFEHKPNGLMLLVR